MTTDTRAVSAQKGRLTPLVVLVPSLTTVVGADFTLVYERELTIVVILVGLAITALAGSRKYGTLLVLGTAFLTLGAGVLGTALLVILELGAGLSCMSGISGWWLAGAVASAALVYLSVGTAGFRAKYPLLVVAFAVILGLIT